MISPRKPQVNINGQHYYYHISFLKLSPAVAFSLQSCLRFSIHKGRQKFEEGSQLSWSQTSEGLSFSKNHLNFAVFNYDGKKQEEFTLKLTIVSSQGETVLDQCILDYGAYISALKSLDTKHFISQCTMESGAILHIEVFVEQTRYALEKLVRESGTGKSRNDESSRSAIIKVSDKRIDKSLSPKRGRENPFKRLSPKRQRKAFGDQSNNSAELSINIANISPLKSSEQKIQQSLVINRDWPKEQKIQQIGKEKTQIEKEEKIVVIQQPHSQHYVIGQQFTQTIQLSDNNFQTKQEIQQQKKIEQQEVIKEQTPQSKIQETKQCSIPPQNMQKDEIKIQSQQRKDFFEDKSLKFKLFFIAVILISLILQGVLQRRENPNLIPQLANNQTLSSIPQKTKKTNISSKIKSEKVKKGKIIRSI